MMKLQVTLFCTTGKYKPMSTVIEVESVEDYKENKAKYQKRAIEKICAQRYTNTFYLNQQGYTQIKVRKYQEKE